ncbi:hypothetical protein CQ12_15455 [Bradyrhizobium jicamae]|uniref:Uncharacterized protein n=1 Tax=Bradyrhizobium jicamae TaxID=280332 RepID=A0A0R3L3X3_9BRAD|nr:hypothetical protein [Bradyrhizobium jicamae]KRR02458.1 hypothetical protein CQ12_15455 [Bradyrhizobium jicamae]
MRLAEALERLHTARRFVAQGEKDLRYQRKLVERLEQRGRNSLIALELLERIQAMQDEYLAHEERVSHQVMSILRAE